MQEELFTIEKHKGKYEIHGHVDNNGCWICDSHAKKKRYPSGKHTYYQINRIINGKKKNWLMHRYIFELYNGEIKEDMVIRHTCDNVLCINPNHLIEGTIKDNHNDMVERNRHAFGEKSGTSKLKEEDIIKIKELYKDGLSQSSISKIYNVSQRNISNVVNNKSWKHI